MIATYTTSESCYTMTETSPYPITIATSEPLRSSTTSQPSLSYTSSEPSPSYSATKSSRQVFTTENATTSNTMDDQLFYATSALAAVFLLTTIILALALIALLLRNRRRSQNTYAAGKGKVNPSYWISDYDLDNPKISASTPNLTDWASPQLSRPTRTFFSPLQRVSEETSSREFEPTGGMVSSKSMAPIAAKVRPQQKMRKSVSYSDLEYKPFSHIGMLSSIPERRRPPSPPKKNTEPSSPSEPSEESLKSPSDDSPKSLSDDSPKSLSDDSPKSPSKETSKPSTDDTQKPLLYEKPTPVPVPRRKKVAAVSEALAKDRNKSVDNDYDSLVSDYVNVKKFGAATDSSPLYEKINTKVMDKPAQYATLAEIRKK